MDTGIFPRGFPFTLLSKMVAGLGRVWACGLSSDPQERGSSEEGV